MRECRCNICSVHLLLSATVNSWFVVVSLILPDFVFFLQLSMRVVCSLR
jgi:hypothetical protein